MKFGKILALATLCLWVSGVVSAKLPPLTDEQAGRAEASKAEAAALAKKDAEFLAKAQDRVVGRYSQQQKAKRVAVRTVPVVAPSIAAAPAKKN